MYRNRICFSIVLLLYIFATLNVLSAQQAEYSTSYRHAVQSIPDTHKVLTELKQVIVTYPDYYFPYLTFTDFLIRKNDSDALQKQLDTYFKKGSFPFNFINAYYAYLKEDKPTCAFWLKHIHNAPENPYFLELMFEMASYSSSYDTPFNLPLLNDNNAFLSIIKQLKENEPSLEKSSSDIESFYSKFSESSHLEIYLFSVKLKVRYLIKSGADRGQIRTILDSARKKINTIKSDVYLSELLIFDVQLMNKNYETELIKETSSTGKYICEKYGLRKTLIRYLARLTQLNLAIKNFTRVDELIETIDKLGSHADKSIISQSLKGEKALFLQDFESAIQLFESALTASRMKKHFMFSELNLLLAEAYFKSGDTKNALNTLDKGCAFTKKNRLVLQYAKLEAFRTKTLLYQNKERPLTPELLLESLVTWSGADRTCISSALFQYFKTYNVYKYAYFFGKLLCNEVLTENEQLMLYSDMFQLTDTGKCNPFFTGPLSIYLSFPYIEKTKSMLDRQQSKTFESAKDEYTFLAKKLEIESIYSEGSRKKTIVTFSIIIICVVISYGLIILIGSIIKNRQKIIGPYKIISKLGEGGMGTVYLARALKHRKKVALKVFKKELADSDEFVKRFHRECEIIQRLDHPNILKYMGHGTHKDQLYLTTDYIDGVTLDKLIEKKWPFSENFLKHIISDLLNALEYLHSESIIHRDIKTSNLIYSEDKWFSGFSGKFKKPLLKVMDFGIAKDQTRSKITVVDKFLGTPVSIAPEVYKGKDADCRSDIYSIGVVLYELFTGALPFRHHEPAVLLYQISNTVPVPPEKIYNRVSDTVSTIIMKCLEKDPDSRFQNIGDLKDALINYFSKHSDTF